MGTFRPRERVADLCKRVDLILARNWLLDRYWLLSQPSADCSKIVYCQVVEIDATNRAHCVTVLHVFGKLVRVREDYPISRSLSQPQERRYLRVGEVGAL
jgi:hypothetical protein